MGSKRISDSRLHHMPGQTIETKNHSTARNRAKRAKGFLRDKEREQDEGIILKISACTVAGCTTFSLSIAELYTALPPKAVNEEG